MLKWQEDKSPNVQKPRLDDKSADVVQNLSTTKNKVYTQQKK